MNEKTGHIRRYYLITSGILISGLFTSLSIYLSADEEQYNPFAEYEGSKKFAYELERIGGKSAVVANDLNNWFFGLWHGRQLSYTVAVITIIIAAVFYVVASGVKPNHQEEKNGNDD